MNEDADARAAGLKPGSIDRLHRRLAKAVAGFAQENVHSDTQTMMAVVSTHVLDLLHETAKACGGGTLEPGAFQRWVTSVGGMIERGEHRIGASH